MTPLPIRVLGDPILRKETTPVTSITNDLRQLIDAMFTTMYAARGIGLAAPQVGRTERLTIVDVNDEPLVLINPEVLASNGMERDEEGCLSIPDIYGDVDRPSTIHFRAMDRDREFKLPPCCLSGMQQDLPCTSAGEPRTPVIVVPLACH